MLETTGTVTANEFLGGDAFWMEIRVPDVAAVALPGQFFMIRCAEGVDPLTARPFSVADVVDDRIAMAYIVVGKGTKLLSEMKPGQTVPVLGPLGRPFKYEIPAKRHVMIAGGIGSAPFPYLARALRETAPESERIMIYGGRSKEHLYALDRFEELMTTVETATDDGSHGHEGFVTDLMPKYLEDPATRFYACGPTPMFQSIAKRLEGHENPCEISVEPIMACGFGACYGCVVPMRLGNDFVYVKSCENGPTFEIRELVVEMMEAH